MPMETYKVQVLRPEKPIEVRWVRARTYGNAARAVRKSIGNRTCKREHITIRVVIAET